MDFQVKVLRLPSRPTLTNKIFDSQVIKDSKVNFTGLQVIDATDYQVVKVSKS